MKQTKNSLTDSLTHSIPIHSLAHVLVPALTKIPFIHSGTHSIPIHWLTHLLVPVFGAVSCWCPEQGVLITDRGLHVQQITARDRRVQRTPPRATTLTGARYTPIVGHVLFRFVEDPTLPMYPSPPKKNQKKKKIFFLSKNHAKTKQLALLLLFF